MAFSEKLQRDAQWVIEQCAIILPQYIKYSDEMCKIGKGLNPSSEYQPEDIANWLSKIGQQMKNET